MSRQPSKIIYNLGRDECSRLLELIIEGNTFTLHRHAANQKDDSVRLELTPLQAAELVEVLKP